MKNKDVNVNKLMSLNIQFFAEGGDDTAGSTDDTADTAGNTAA